MRDWIGIDEVVAVADTGNFASAARALGRSTSHVSRAIAQLEARLGGEIFHRTTRSVTLSPLGENLAGLFRRLVEDRNEAFEWAEGGGEPHGELRISCSTTLGERFVAPIVREYAQRFPAVSVLMDLSNRVVDVVGEGYDLAIRTGHIGDPRLVGVQLASRKLILCASTDYVSRNGMPSSAEALDDLDCIAGSAQHWQFRGEHGNFFYKPSARLRCNSGIAVLDAIVAGMGIGQLPTFYLHGHLVNDLVELLPHLRVADEPVWGAYAKRRQVTPKLRELLTMLATSLKPALDPPASLSHGAEPAQTNAYLPLPTV
ncbi:MAG: LysR family transcriptional regulator [Sphingomonadales bacterium]|nr:MAG: LysR family transcriptional regulator [Sphingomonadales bacterium]